MHFSLRKMLWAIAASIHPLLERWHFLHISQVALWWGKGQKSMWFPFTSLGRYSALTCSSGQTQSHWDHGALPQTETSVVCGLLLIPLILVWESAFWWHSSNYCVIAQSFLLHRLFIFYRLSLKISLQMSPDQAVFFLYLPVVTISPSGPHSVIMNMSCLY